MSDDVLIEPGRLGTIDEATDRADAEALLEMLRGCAAAHAGPSGRTSAAAKLARQSIAAIWDEPRLRALGKEKGRYGRWPRSFPWSPAAHAVFHQFPDKAPSGVFVLEHLVPFKAHVVELFSQVDGMDAAGLIEYLHNRNVFAVITSVDDQLLNAAGLRRSTPDVSRVWARYEQIEALRPEGFAPLPEVGHSLSAP